MHCTLNTPPPQKDILRIQSSTPRSTVLAIKQYYRKSNNVNSSPYYYYYLNYERCAITLVFTAFIMVIVIYVYAAITIFICQCFMYILL